jgi:putative oxidoreductase
MSYGLLLLRAVLGLTLAVHGAQKLFGWFGGGGPQGTAGSFRGLHFRAPLAMALLAGLAEFGGGLALTVGLATPLASFALIVVMLNAISTVHWPNGFFNGKGGFEFNLLILAAAAALAATGPGRFAIDRLIGWDDKISGLWWGGGALAAAALTSLLTLAFGRERHAAAPQHG